MFARFARALLLVSIASLVVAAPVSASSRRVYVQNFNDYPQGEWLKGSAISSWEIRYADQQCGGTIGCQDWWIVGAETPDGRLQDGLGGGDQKGPIVGRFTYPVTSIKLIAQGAYQFNAAYTLTAFDRKGRAVGRTTVVNNGDQGLPNFSGFGYFPMSLSHLKGQACSFKLSAKWLAASFYNQAGYEMGWIKVTLANGWHEHRCR